ncbi:MAG: hypothetical protein GXW96_07090 [Christensenellaceae bacterium]|nr:hypothetical protein [Christensenellaceae bacterium]
MKQVENKALTKRLRPVVKRAWSGRRIMHTAQAISARPSTAESRESDKAD